MTIAIDGPVASGKSTIARALAQALGIVHLDTGRMYRALGLKALRVGISPEDAAAAEALMAATHIEAIPSPAGQRTYLDGEDVTALLDAPEVSDAASAIGRVPGVRRRLVALQQAYAENTDIVMDGRDIGIRVLPDATYKFFLTASEEVRVQRRLADYRRQKKNLSLEAVRADLRERDRQDMEREEDPLQKAPDARLIDTSALDKEQTIALLLDIIREGRP